MKVLCFERLVGKLELVNKIDIKKNYLNQSCENTL